MTRTITCLTLLALVSPAAAAAPTDREKLLAPFIEEETFALVRFDTEKFDVDGLLRALARLHPFDKDCVANFGTKTKEFSTAFKRAGGKEVVVVFSIPEFPNPSLGSVD